MDDVTVTPYRDGPIIVRGPVQRIDGEGRAIVTHRKTIALCRCGRSTIHPLCDGMHKRIGFSAPGRDGRAVARCALEAPEEA